MSGHRSKSYVGKLVDSWCYEVKDMVVNFREPDEDNDKMLNVQRVVNKKVIVEVRVHKSTDESREPPHPTTGVEFSVTCKDVNMDLKGTDIECLRAAAWAKLDEKFEINWEPYFLVRLGPERVYHGFGTGMSFSWEWVYKGTTWDGKLLLKETSGYRDDKISPWPGQFKDDKGKIIACIRETDENKSALEEFSKRIDTLRKMLAEFLKPETIMQTLASMNDLKLLPPIEPKSDDES